MGQLYVSWAWSLSVFRMSIILYIFQALLIQVPPAFFKTMQKAISSLLWDKGKARYPHDTLRKHRREGGMGVMDLQDYYTAMLLD